MDPIQYKLESAKGDELKGKFYGQEMVRATPRDDELWEIEKFVDKRMKNGQEEVKVRWKGHGKADDSWVFIKDLIDLPGLKPQTSNQKDE